MQATVLFGETSEITGAEHIAVSRAATPEVGAAFYRTWKACNDSIVGTGANLMGSQPTEGNIRGGLTTVEEKALGNPRKIGRRARYIGVVGPAEAITLWAAAGSVLHLFTTGQGNVVGNALVPVIKTSANPLTVRTMPEHIDVDVSGILLREMTLDEASDALMGMLLRTLNGRLTAAEVLGHREFVISRVHRTA